MLQYGRFGGKYPLHNTGNMRKWASKGKHSEGQSGQKATWLRVLLRSPQGHVCPHPHPPYCSHHHCSGNAAVVIRKLEFFAP